MIAIKQAQEMVLTCLADKIPEFYLVGGTALSEFYFHHRESFDLDFFTRKYDNTQVLAIIERLKKEIGIRAKLLNSSAKEGLAKFSIYLTSFPDNTELKLDFVEDYINLLEPFNLVNGVNVLAIEDIYLRKLFAAGGTVAALDETGKIISLGGRQEAKDFFDLYFLSTTLSPMSTFVKENGSNQLKEGLIRWFRSYDRLSMKTGLLDIKTRTPIDYKIAEKHFKGEIDKILEEEIN